MPKLRRLVEAPPDARGDAEEQLRDLRDYLIGVTEELEYVLTHLEAENIDDTMWEKISALIPKPYGGAPLMDGASSAGGSRNYARGDHRHPKDASKADAAALTSHTGNTANPHGVTAAQTGAIPTGEKGAAGGVAALDASGKIPSAQLPSYVDDVLEYASLSAFPATGESGKIYVALDTNKTYRWSGSAYVEISESLALGETSSTAYRGDRGKAAYDHSQVTGNPHGTTAADVGLGNVDNVQQYSASNPPPYPVTSVNGATGAVTVTVPEAYTSNPAMDGDASPGSSTKWAKGDHVHPTDTSRAPITHMGISAKAGSLGHVWLSDEVYEAFGENDGKASTPIAVKTVYDATNPLAELAQIAPVEEQYVASQSYSAGDYFVKVDETYVGATPLWSRKLYRATATIAAGAALTPGTNCEEVTVGSELQTKPGYEMLAPLETSTTASRDYTYGERFVYGGVLYQAIAPIASGGTITPGTNCQDATNLESRFRTYSYSANGTYTVTLARNSRRYLVIADRLGRAAALVNYIAYNGNTPQMVTIADIDSANRGISLSVSGATLTITVSATYAVVKIMEV